MTGRAALALAGFSVAAIGFAALAHPVPRLVWNASASAPLGLYRTSSDPVARGDFVLAEPPEAARRLAATRGYLPDGVALVKRVAALSGDVVCASGRAVLINGRAVAERLDHDSQSRRLPAWTGCRTLAADQVFLLMEGVSDSFDGRYFGPISREAVIAKLLPVWTFGQAPEGEKRDSRIKGVPSDSAEGLVCTSILATAPAAGCRRPPANPLNSLLTKPVSGDDGERHVTRSARPLSQQCRDP